MTMQRPSPHLISGDTPTPGAPLPIINEKTRIGFRLSTWAQIIIGVGAFTVTVFIPFVIWLTKLHCDVGALKESVAEIRADVKSLLPTQTPVKGSP